MSVKIIERLDKLIEQGNQISQMKFTESVKKGYNMLDGYYLYLQWKMSCLNIIDRICDANSVYRNSIPDKDTWTDFNIRGKVVETLSIMKSLREETEYGLITNIENLISKDILISINDEASALLDAGYKDASAIYCRVMLESGIKKMCDNNDINYNQNIKLNTLINTLKSNKVLNTIEWRQVLAWVDIGNAAAHGEFDKYDNEEVVLMLKGISKFMNEKLS